MIFQASTERRKAVFDKILPADDKLSQITVSRAMGFDYLCTVMKRNLHIISIIAALCLSGAASSAAHATGNRAIKGFSGGMMLHTGFLSGCDNPYGYNPSGATFGIGGVARLHLSGHFRAGFEGYFSNMGLKKDIASGSFNKLFWTGILADWCWHAGKFHPYAGASIGGGMETAYYMFEGDKHDWEPEGMAVYNKKPFFALDPFIGVEYSVGEALRLTLKADWLMAINRDGLNRPMGPRIYFGFIFAH